MLISLSLLQHIGKKLNELLEIFVGLILFVMLFSIILQVFARYFFHSSFSWPEEVAMYLMAWLTFIGGSVATYRWQHISVDIVSSLFKGKIAIIVHLVTAVIFSILALFLLVSGTNLVSVSWNVITDALHIPLAYIRASMPIGGAVMAYHCLVHILSDIDALLRYDEV